MIEITLHVTTAQLVAIANVLNDAQLGVNKVLEVRDTVVSNFPIPEHAPEKAQDSPKTVKEPKEVIPVATRKVGGKKGPKMASFGRTQEQIDAFAKAEEERTVELDEEAELKKQRDEERAVRKAEKDQEAKEKKDEEDRAKAEVLAIKEKEQLNVQETASPLAKKPWQL